MNIKDIENLAALARLELTEKEKEGLLSDMDSILGYVKQIEEMKVEEVEAEYGVYNVWREDSPAVASVESFSREFITEQFPSSKDGFLKVKKIL